MELYFEQGKRILPMKAFFFLLTSAPGCGILAIFIAYKISNTISEFENHENINKDINKHEVNQIDNKPT